VAVAKAKAKERERPQITVATVIQKPGEDVKKKGVPKPNMKDKKSKESQVLDVLKKYMPDDKVRLAMFHELMPIMREGGTHRERKKKIVVKREKEAVVNVKVAEEAQKAVDTAVIAVETAVIAAEEAESAEAAATQKVAEEAIIECGECNTLSIAETVTSKVCNDCLRITAEKAAAEKAAEEERLIAAEAQNFFEQLVAEIAADVAEEEKFFRYCEKVIFKRMKIENAREYYMAEEERQKHKDRVAELETMNRELNRDAYFWHMRFKDKEKELAEAHKRRKTA
jgi:hypothetical protein